MFFVRDMAVQGQFLSKFNGSRQCLASERGTRDRQPCLRAARVPRYGKDSDSIARAPTADCLPPRTPNKSSDRSGKLVNNYHLSRAGQFQGILKWMIHIPRVLRMDLRSGQLTIEGAATITVGSATSSPSSLLIPSSQTRMPRRW